MCTVPNTIHLYKYTNYFHFIIKLTYSSSIVYHYLQGLKLHVFVSVTFPLHPAAKGWSEHVLVLVWIPWPHSTLHLPQACQCSHTPTYVFQVKFCNNLKQRIKHFKVKTFYFTISHRKWFIIWMFKYEICCYACHSTELFYSRYIMTIFITMHKENIIHICTICKYHRYWQNCVVKRCADC